MKRIIGIGVLLVTKDNLFILQERDDRAILHPGEIAAFGGGIEGSETAVQCAQRELMEELAYPISVVRLHEIGLFNTYPNANDLIMMFLIRDVDVDKHYLREGRNIIVTSKDDALTNPKVTDFTKNILNLI